MCADRGLGSGGHDYVGDLGGLGVMRLNAQEVEELRELVETGQVDVDLSEWVPDTQLADV